MKYKGKIKDVNHIVVSDPTYKKNDGLRYEINNLKGKNWDVELEINSVEDNIGNYTIHGTEFYIVLQKEKGLCKVEEENIKYLKDIKIKKYDIGMDTACIALGINNNAEEIINSQEEWQPDCAIKTGTDGIFGLVTEGKRDNDIVFVVITGCLSDYMDYGANDLFDYLVQQFEIRDLEFDVLKDTDSNNGMEINK